MDSYEFETLTYVNIIRESLGFPKMMKLRSGLPRRAGSCPIARSLPEDAHASVNCNFVSVLVNYQTRTIEIPYAVSRFISKFDSGHYPHLIIKTRWWQR